jgi:hypothetical protein
MRTLIGTALLAAMLMSGVSAQVANANDVSARRYHRHHRYAYRPNYPYPMYYGRPVYYAPAPFLPIPPFFGYGWEWW